MKKRSLGLTILGWFEILLGGGGILFASLCWIFLIGMFSDYGRENFLTLDECVYLILATLATLSPVTSFTIGIGILKLKKWAWKLNIFLYPIIYIYIHIIFFKLAQRLKTSIFAHIIENIPIILWFSIPIITIFYLTRPKVRAQFFTNKPDINTNHSKEENAV